MRPCYPTLFHHRASDELMKRYNKPRAFMGLRTYLFEGLKHQRNYDSFHFETAEMLQEFEQRVHSWEMRDQMREDYQKMDDEAKSKLDGPIIEYLQKCPHCKIHQFYACHHIPYEDVVKLHDLICNTPPPLVCFPSQEIMRKLNVLPENIQQYLKQGCPSGLDFKMDEQRTMFEEQVEVETLRQEILYRYAGLSAEKRMEISPKLNLIFPKNSLPYEDEWILTNRVFSMEQMKQIHSIVFPPKEKSSEDAYQIVHKFKALPEGVQTYLKQAYSKDRTVFEEQVEVETLRQEILYRYPGMSEEERKEISPKLKTIFSKISLPWDFEDEWVLDNVRFSMEQMRQIYSIVFPPKEKSFEDYITRATALLHNVADIAVRNRRMADYIVGPCLKKFATTVIKSVGDFNYLQNLEKIVCVAMDPENCFSLLFEKHEKITPQQMDIIIGMIDIPFEAKSRNIEFIAHSSLRIKGHLAEKILMEFLKKI